MNDKQIAELEEKARSATPGPWDYYLETGMEGHGVVITYKVLGDGFHRSMGDSVFKKLYTTEQNKMYLADANPIAILSLIDRLKECEKALKGYKVVSLPDKILRDDYFDKWGHG